MHHVFWHCCVYLARQLDEARVFAILTRLPCKVEWIDWDAVTSPSRPRVERHEPKRLRLGRFDNFPDINSHGGVHQLQLVHQRDIHAPENVLQQLGRFSYAARRDRYKCIDRFTIKRHSAIEAGGCVTPHDLWNQLHLGFFVSRVLSLWGESEVEIQSRFHSRAFLQNYAQILVGRSWIGRRF